MKILSIAMVASALVLASASSSADPSLDRFKMQKPMEMSSVAHSKVMQLSFNNKERYTGEKEIYEKVIDLELTRSFILYVMKLHRGGKEWIIEYLRQSQQRRRC